MTDWLVEVGFQESEVDERLGGVGFRKSEAADGAAASASRNPALPGAYCSGFTGVESLISPNPLGFAACLSKNCSLIDHFLP